MATDERPLSPFLIYRPQLTSVLSTMHRLTGLLLSVASLLLIVWLAALAGGPESYARTCAWLSGPAGLVLLVCASIGFFYHLSNGIRHLFWDAGYGFELPQVYRSGWTVVGATVLLTAAFWLAAFGMTS